MKISGDNIGNRNCDLPACSAVPQPTALPHALTRIGYSAIKIVCPKSSGLCKIVLLCAWKRFIVINPLKPELNFICYLLALLGAHHFLHVSRIRVKLLTLRLLMPYIYIYGAPILDVSRSHTTTQHSR